MGIFSLHTMYKDKLLKTKKELILSTKIKSKIPKKSSFHIANISNK